MWDLLTPEELALKARCREFAAREIAPRARRYDEANEFPREVHDAAYEAGLMNLGIPVELGGGGVTQRALVVAGEELAAACSPTAFSMGFNHGSLRPVLLHGTPAQRERFVGALIRARRYASICLTEPAASGSNLMALGTRAVKTAAGWAISGTKCMVGNGTVADLFLVLANAVVDGQKRGLTFFAVPRGDGVRVGDNTDKLGFRCVTTPTVDFDGAVVADDCVIGEVGGGERVLLDTLDYIRFGGSSVILGVVVGALREVVPWLEQRRVYGGEPLINQSHVQLLLGELYSEVRAVRMLSWRAADLLDAGAPCSLETSIAKLRASELAVRATNEIAQLYGWRGIDNDYAIHKRLRDARVTTIYEGTSEVQRLTIFRALRASLASDGNL